MNTMNSGLYSNTYGAKKETLAFLNKNLTKSEKALEHANNENDRHNIMVKISCWRTAIACVEESLKKYGL